jgi:hypothetical protein
MVRIEDAVESRDKEEKRLREAVKIAQETFGNGFIYTLGINMFYISHRSTVNREVGVVHIDSDSLTLRGEEFFPKAQKFGEKYEGRLMTNGEFTIIKDYSQ